MFLNLSTGLKLMNILNKYKLLTLCYLLSYYYHSTWLSVEEYDRLTPIFSIIL